VTAQKTGASRKDLTVATGTAHNNGVVPANGDVFTVCQADACEVMTVNTFSAGATVDTITMTSDFSRAQDVVGSVPATRLIGHTLATSASWKDALLLNTDDTFWIGTDELKVGSTAAHLTDSTVTVSATTPITAAYASAQAWQDAFGYQRGIVFKSASANAETLRAVPEPNWRGIGARLQVKRARGAAAHSIELGTPVAVQTVALRSDVQQATATTWKLQLGDETTAAMPWYGAAGDGTTTAVLASKLQLLSIVDRVTVVRTPADGDTRSADYSHGFVYTVSFWGLSGAASEIPTLAAGAVDNAAGGSTTSVVINVVRAGVAHGTYLQRYLSLNANTQYKIRLAAANSEGYGPVSAPFTVSTAAVGVVPGAPRGVVLERHSSTSLRLLYQAPQNDGGVPITRYHIEWDTSGAFDRTSAGFGERDLALVYEVQDVITSYRSGNPAGGFFTLTWGGLTTAPLAYNAAPASVAAALQTITSTSTVGLNPIKVTQTAQGRGFRWRVTFDGINGNLGKMQADGHMLLGDKPEIRVAEVTNGVADLVPGHFTYEVQTVTATGYSDLGGTFTLTFEGRTTSNIAFGATAAEMTTHLEGLDTIHTVSVAKLSASAAHHVWAVTFTHEVHEVEQGAGNIGLMLADSAQLTGDSATVSVATSISGTEPRSVVIDGLATGTEYHARVSAYNPLGYGSLSTTATGAAYAPPGPPTGATLAVASGTSLAVAWNPPSLTGGDAIGSYKVEWFTAAGSPEVQQITTSANAGITEVQVVRVASQSNNLGGFFNLGFNGETTRDIEFNSQPSTVKAELQRLSTIGTVTVTREFSKLLVTGMKLIVPQNCAATCTLSAAGGAINTLADFTTEFAVGDKIWLHGVADTPYTVSAVTANQVKLGDGAGGRPTESITLASAAGLPQTSVSKWAYGYQWTITFASHVGDQPELVPSTSNNWRGTSPTLTVWTEREGLQPLSGTFRVALKSALTGKSQKTYPLAHDVGAAEMQEALTQLTTGGPVQVRREVNGYGHNWVVTFTNELGNVEQMVADSNSLSGPSASVKVSTPPGAGGGSAVQNAVVTAPATAYTIAALTRGTTYFVRVTAFTQKGGFGTYAITAPPSATPREKPAPPQNVLLMSLAGNMLKVVWSEPVHDGGAAIDKYRVEWDTDTAFTYSSEVVASSPTGPYHYNIVLPAGSEHKPRFVRVKAHNIVDYSDPAASTPASLAPSITAPGAPENVRLTVLSSVGLRVDWGAPDANQAVFGGDGGSAITQYMVEWDESATFDSPAAHSVVTMPSSQTYTIGGNDIITGVKQTTLMAGKTYYVRVTAFNARGASPVSLAVSATTADRVPWPPLNLGAAASSKSSLLQTWDEPPYDGGKSLTTYHVEWDTQGDFGSGSAGSVELPLVRDVQSITANATVVNEEQHIRATVAVTNERQTVRTTAGWSGVDEVQVIETTAATVTNEQQTVTTWATDRDEIQSIEMSAPDLPNEQQVVITDVATPILEVQKIQIYAARSSEIQVVSVTFPAGATNDLDETAAANEYGTGTDGHQNALVNNLNAHDPAGTTGTCYDDPTDATVPATACNTLTTAKTCKAVTGCKFATGTCTGGTPASQCAIDHTQCAANNVGACRATVNSCEAATCTGGAGAGCSGAAVDKCTWTENVLGGFRLKFDTDSDAPNNPSFAPGCRWCAVKTATGTTTMTINPWAAATDSNYIQKRLEALPTIGAGKLTVSAPDTTSDVTKISWTITFSGDEVRGNVPDLVEVPVHNIRPSASIKTEYNERPTVGITTTATGADASGQVVLGYQCEDYSMPTNYGTNAGQSPDCVAIPERETSVMDWDITGPDLRTKLQAVPTIAEVEVSARTMMTDTANKLGYEWLVTFKGNHGNIKDIVCHKNGAKHPGTHLVATAGGGTVSCDVTQVTAGSMLSGTFKLQENLGLCGGGTDGKCAPHVDIDTCQAATCTGGNDANGVGCNAGKCVWGTSVCYGSTDGACQVHRTQAGCQAQACVGAACTAGKCNWGADPAGPLASAALAWDISETALATQLGLVNNAATAPTTLLQSPLPLVTALSSTINIGGKVHGTVTVTRTAYPETGKWSGGWKWVIDWQNRLGNVPRLVATDMGTTGAGGVNLVSATTDTNLVSTVTVTNPTDGSEISEMPGNQFLLDYTAGTTTTTGTFTPRMTHAEFETAFNTAMFGGVDKVDVSRMGPTKARGYTWSVTFTHIDVGGDQAQIALKDKSSMAANVGITTKEVDKGNAVRGNFQLKFRGALTAEMAYDVDPAVMESKINNLATVGPSKVKVTRAAITGVDAEATDDASKQVDGYRWTITYDSNGWYDPAAHQPATYVTSNWMGNPAKWSDVWPVDVSGSQAFSKAWGKNVGDMPDIECVKSSLKVSNTAGGVPSCNVRETVKGTRPVGGTFTLTLDSSACAGNPVPGTADDTTVNHLNQCRIGKKASLTTGAIAHNAVATSTESGGSGESLEEKLEALDNVGDVEVSRSAVDATTGGYKWTVTFKRDDPAHCEIKDTALNLCNSPGHVPRLVPSQTGLLGDSRTIFVFDDAGKVDGAGAATAGAAHAHAAVVKNGAVLRGEFSAFRVTGDPAPAGGTKMLRWDATEAEVKAYLQARAQYATATVSGRAVEVQRTVIGQYGAMEWTIRFTKNPGQTPPGAGDIAGITATGLSWTGLAAPANVWPAVEVQKGSTGLSGAFTVDFSQSPLNARTVSFQETAARMELKLDEMETVADVSVSREEYPSSTTGGWGAQQVADGTVGGYVWKVRFMRATGTYDGLTFPPGAGDVPTLVVGMPATNVLAGTSKDASVHMQTQGSAPMSGSITIGMLGKQTRALDHSIDSVVLEQELEAINAVGGVTCAREDLLAQQIVGASVQAGRDAAFATVSGAVDLTKQLSPGDAVRVGGDQALGDATAVTASPLLATAANHVTKVTPGQRVRVAGDDYTLERTGAEVQVLTVVAADADHASGTHKFYKLRLIHSGDQPSTPDSTGTGCMDLHASAADLTSALNTAFFAGVAADGVVVTRERVNFATQKGYRYTVYYTGLKAAGDVNELLVSTDGCTGLANSRAEISTLKQGGAVEVQRLTMAVDAGTRSKGSFFKLVHYDGTARATTGCLDWGATAAEVEAQLQGLTTLDANADEHLVRVTRDGDGTSDTEQQTLSVTASAPVTATNHASTEGYYRLRFTHDRQAPLRVEQVSAASVLTVTGHGLTEAAEVYLSGTFVAEVAETNLHRDRPFFVRVLDANTFTLHPTLADVTDDADPRPNKVTMTAFAGIGAKELFVTGHVPMQAVTSTCLHFDATATEMKAAIESLPQVPAGHVRVSRSGAGAAVDGYGYTYVIDFRGPVGVGSSSAVLGNMEQLEVLPLWKGDNNAGGLGLGKDCVAVTGGNPSLVMTTTRQGRPSYTYDVFFVGSLLNDQATLVVDDGDAACAGSTPTGGSVSNVRVHPMTNGGGGAEQTVTITATSAAVPTAAGIYKLSMTGLNIAKSQPLTPLTSSVITYASSDNTATKAAAKLRGANSLDGAPVQIAPLDYATAPPLVQGTADLNNAAGWSTTGTYYTRRNSDDSKITLHTNQARAKDPANTAGRDITKIDADQHSRTYYGGTGSTIVDLKALSASPLTLVYRNQFTVHVHDQLKATAANKDFKGPAAAADQNLASGDGIFLRGTHAEVGTGKTLYFARAIDADSNGKAEYASLHTSHAGATHATNHNQNLVDIRALGSGVMLYTSPGGLADPSISAVSADDVITTPADTRRATGDAVELATTGTLLGATTGGHPQLCTTTATSANAACQYYVHRISDTQVTLQTTAPIVITSVNEAKDYFVANSAHGIKSGEVAQISRKAGGGNAFPTVTSPRAWQDTDAVPKKLWLRVAEGGTATSPSTTQFSLYRGVDGNRPAADGTNSPFSTTQLNNNANAYVLEVPTGKFKTLDKVALSSDGSTLGHASVAEPYDTEYRVRLQSLGTGSGGTDLITLHDGTKRASVGSTAESIITFAANKLELTDNTFEYTPTADVTLPDSGAGNAVWVSNIDGSANNLAQNLNVATPYYVRVHTIGASNKVTLHTTPMQTINLNNNVAGVAGTSYGEMRGRCWDDNNNNQVANTCTGTTPGACTGNCQWRADGSVVRFSATNIPSFVTNSATSYAILGSRGSSGATGASIPDDRFVLVASANLKSATSANVLALGTTGAANTKSLYGFCTYSATAGEDGNAVCRVGGAGNNGAYITGTDGANGETACNARTYDNNAAVGAGSCANNGLVTTNSLGNACTAQTTQANCDGGCAWTSNIDTRNCVFTYYAGNKITVAGMSDAATVVLGGDLPTLKNTGGFGATQLFHANGNGGARVSYRLKLRTDIAADTYELLHATNNVPADINNLAAGTLYLVQDDLTTTNSDGIVGITTATTGSAFLGTQADAVDINAAAPGTINVHYIAKQRRALGNGAAALPGTHYLSLTSDELDLDNAGVTLVAGSLHVSRGHSDAGTNPRVRANPHAAGNYIVYRDATENAFEAEVSDVLHSTRPGDGLSHGLVDGDEVKLVTAAGTLPTGLAAATSYYVRRLRDDGGGGDAAAGQGTTQSTALFTLHSVAGATGATMADACAAGMRHRTESSVTNMEGVFGGADTNVLMRGRLSYCTANLVSPTTLGVDRVWTVHQEKYVPHTTEEFASTGAGPTAIKTGQALMLTMPTLATGGRLPLPLLSTKTYYARMISNDVLTLHYDNAGANNANSNSGFGAASGAANTVDIGNTAGTQGTGDGSDFGDGSWVPAGPTPTPTPHSIIVSATDCLKWGATAAEMEGALNKLVVEISDAGGTKTDRKVGTGGGGGVTVTRSGTGDQASSYGYTYVVRFAGEYVRGSIPNLDVIKDTNFCPHTTADDAPGALVKVATTRSGATATKELTLGTGYSGEAWGTQAMLLLAPKFRVLAERRDVQRIVVTRAGAAIPPAATFRLQYGAAQTGNLAWDSTDDVVEEAVAQLAGLASGCTRGTCTGNALCTAGNPTHTQATCTAITYGAGSTACTFAVRSVDASYGPYLDGSAPDSCVREVQVTRHEDSVLAPNGHIYYVYFAGSTVEGDIVDLQISSVACTGPAGGACEVRVDKANDGSTNGRPAADADLGNTAAPARTKSPVLFSADKLPLASKADRIVCDKCATILATTSAGPPHEVTLTVTSDLLAELDEGDAIAIEGCIGSLVVRPRGISAFGACAGNAVCTALNAANPTRARCIATRYGATNTRCSWSTGISAIVSARSSCSDFTGATRSVTALKGSAARFSGADATTGGLSLYKTNGHKWTVSMDTYLGDMPPMTVDGGALLGLNRGVGVSEVLKGTLPNTDAITGLTPGLQYHTRISTENELGYGATSTVMTGTPMEVPDALDSVTAGHALHVDEVQTVTTAATHDDEVQVVTTEARSAAEVQMVTTTAPEYSNIAGKFAVRFPEVHTLTLSHASAITGGTFDLRFDLGRGAGAQTLTGGSAVAWNEGAVSLASKLNTLFGAGKEVAVSRNGDGGLTSNDGATPYGYIWSITFVGRDVAGALSKTKAGAANLFTVPAFALTASGTPAAPVAGIANAGQAIGTDTEIQRLTIAAKAPITFGQYMLTFDDTGANAQKTVCIDWNAPASDVEGKIEALSNVDSVRVVRSGDASAASAYGYTYSIYFDGNQVNGNVRMLTHTVGTCLEADRNNPALCTSNAPATAATDCQGFQSTVSGQVVRSGPGNEGVCTGDVGTRTQCSTKSTSGTCVGADVWTSNAGTCANPGTCTNAALCTRCATLTTNAGSTSGVDCASTPAGDGSVATLSSGTCVWTDTKCTWTQAVLLEGVHDGGVELDATALTFEQLSNLLALLPDVHTATVHRSAADLEGGMAWTAAFTPYIDADLTQMVCNTDAAFRAVAGATCTVATLVDGNVLGDTFVLSGSPPIKYDAAPADMVAALEATAGIGSVAVTRTGPTPQRGYVWMVTFLSDIGDVPALQPTSSLSGTDARVTVTEHTKGNQIAGTFTLAYGAETTTALDYAAPATGTGR
jgi:hypothetical protein